jgi:FKBP-type peptidyl-prolyl cis-trans isomerase 2
MSEAQPNDTVKVHYTGKLTDGTVFDSSREREPLEFTIGQQQVIPGFEKAVEGMSPGETKTATIPPEEGYGSFRDDLVQKVGREQFPPEAQVEEGQRFRASADGQDVLLTVVEVDDESVTVDANHPLAGKDLIFDIELVEIE